MNLIKNNNKVYVVYLAWLPYGIGYFKSFLESYKNYEAGCSHELIVAFNGLEEKFDHSPADYIEYARAQGIKISGYYSFPGGQDISIYISVAKLLDEGLVLFFNTYSEIHNKGWLKFYVDAKKSNVGLVSATASNLSYYSAVFQKNAMGWERGKTIAHHFRKYKLFLKAFFYWRFLFKPFPNPHARSNAFLVCRKDFIKMHNKLIATKFQAYQFESGRNSMTNYFLKRGNEVLVIDKYGATYDIRRWKESKTFWFANQENLLVSDNQTGIYRDADIENRKAMTKLAWGCYE